jgi:hypothetical protein
MAAPGEQSGDRVLTAEEARAKLRVSRNALYSWCEQDLVPHRRVGGKIDGDGRRRGGRLLFSERRLDQWIQNGENES